MYHVYKAKITYKVKPTHPDIDYMDNWEVGKEYEFEDVYRIDCLYSREEAVDYIMSDLLLIAGGGYSTDGVYDEKYFIDGREY